MFTSIKTSEENKIKVSKLTSKLQLGAENVIARIAISYSLSNAGVLDIKNIKDSKGKEYSRGVLFGEYTSFYIALICQKYKLYKSNQEISRYIKLHLDNGIESIYNEINNEQRVEGINFLLTIINNGINSIHQN